jgi:alanyl-tRNA synthetase
MQLQQIEQGVNDAILENYPLHKVTKTLQQATAEGAIALFGEKYGESVRTITIGEEPPFSYELCGGTHVEATGSIGIVKIVSEGAIAAGVRRIEAVTAAKAEEYINDRLKTVDEIAMLLKSNGSVTDSVEKILAENSSLKKSVEKFQVQSAVLRLKELTDKAVKVNGINFVSGQIETDSADVLKNIAYHLRTSSANTVMAIGSENGGKANILVTVSEDLVRERNISAVTIIREISGEINGGGGGQPFLATAGGKNPEGIQRAIQKAAEFLKKS